MSEKYIIPTPGDVIAGKYHIEEELGRGAYGVVFRARQEGIDRHVALKTLLPKAFLETDIVERFEREANFVGRLNHPNIVSVHDYGRHENLLYMSVEYVEGETLDEIIAQGPLEPERVRSLVYQMVDALEHAHETGIVHRDLKPANIVILRKPVGESGEEKEVVKVLDFGIAKLIQSETEEEETEGKTPEALTQAGTVLGTPHYMSPESIIGEQVDHRTDIYALGVMIYEMLTGERPFGAKNTPGVMVKHLRDEPPELPPYLAGSCWGDAVRGCMEKDPEKRLQAATDVRKILDRRDEGKYRASVPNNATAKANALADPKTGKRILMPAVAIGILAAVGIAIGFQWIPLGDDGSELSHVSTESSTKATVPAEQPAEQPTGEKAGAEEPVAESEDHETMDFADDEPGAGDDKSESDGQLGVDNAVEVADRSNTLGTAAEGQPDDEPIDKERPDKSKDGAKSRQGTRAGRDKDRRKDQKSAAQKKVTLHIETVPSKARVSVGGTPVGASPVDYTIAAGDDPVTVELHHIGYRTKFRSIVPDKDQTLRVELEKGRLKLIP
jgi:serine/threonine protein kinase